MLLHGWEGDGEIDPECVVHAAQFSFQRKFGFGGPSRGRKSIHSCLRLIHSSPSRSVWVVLYLPRIHTIYGDTSEKKMPRG